MAETQPQETPAPKTHVDESAPAPGRLQRFVLNHPRAAKVAAFTSAISGVVGVVAIAKSLRKDQEEDASHDIVVGEVLSTDYSTSESPVTTDV